MSNLPSTQSRKKRRAGVISAIAGLAAAGLAAGVAAERYVMNKARRDPDDPYHDEPFGRLHADRIRTVASSDGVSVHVETVGTRYEPGDGGADAPTATVVFVHGYCLDQGTFHFQRRALTESTLPVRAVFYDQPGHGRSSEIPEAEHDIDSLAETLYAVIGQTAPSGPLILVGHSMGAMTILAFARRHAELFASRVTAVALLSTSSGGLSEVTFGAPRVLARARRVVLPVLGRAAALTPGAIDRTRKIVGDLAWMLTRRYGFATERPSPSLVSYVEEMNTNTPIRTVIGFSRTLLEHDERGSLRGLANVPVLIISGSDDQFTPAAHAVELAEALPHATLIIIPDTGHIALLEKPADTTEPLLGMIASVVDTITANAVDESTPRRKPWRRKKTENGNER
ncbi:alpha/beta fold hydrolase [Stackebrandtia soli]|uniref:alpha/beta fold hydrolase n=1 Tax=Stackebrandtia soli TaxID=1892856 RepID=UPI0039ECDA00